MKTSVLKYYYFFVLGISASVFGQNYSLSFDGDDDRVELPNQITEGLTSVTFMAWFNTTDHSGYSNIVQDDGPSGALFIRYNPDGSFKYVFKADQGWRSISISPPSYGVWHHVAMSWDGTNIKAYLDGEEVGNSNGSGTMSGGGPIYIGNWQQQEGFSGKIDDVQYWNIALSESEIQSHMNTELVGNEEGLIGYWNFNQGEGPELTDLSGNGYNGAIYGASWSGDGAPVESPVYGCTDINAENYNPDATADDGSCAGYPDNGNYSLSFDGEDDYVALPDIDLLGNYTLSMTYKPTSHDDYNSLFNKYPAYALMEGAGSGSLYAHPKEGYDCSTGQNVSLNEWHNVSLVFNSDEMHFYIDGDLIHSCDDMPNSDNNSYNLTIGKAARLDGEYLNGFIDDAAIWSAALSQSDIQQYISGNTPDTDNLVGHWNFNEGEGDVLYDHSGNQNHGTIYDATWNLLPVEGGNNSLSFDGVDDYVNVGSADNFGFETTDELTIFAWIKADQIPNMYPHIIGAGSDGRKLQLWMFENRKIEFRLVVGSNMAWVTTPSTLELDQWYHIAATYSSETGRSIYINGDLEASDASTGEIGVIDSDIYIGSNPFLTPREFSGIIDEVSIWNVAMDQGQIQDQMSQELSGQEQGLAGYWNFNEGEGPDLTDLGGNGNHGTIYGATWSGDAAPVEPPVYGCTDSYAENYNPDATADDGSCAGYPDNGEYVLSFDGNGDHVKVESIMNGPVGTIDFTFSSWIKLSRTDVNSAMVILCSNELDQFQFAINTGGGSGGVFDAYIGGSGTSTPSLFWESNVWYHIAAVRQNGNVKYYRDGVFINETNNGSYINSPSYYDIGYRTSNSAHPFYGNINNLAIWETALTEEQIQSHMSGEFSGEEEGLAAYWKFNSGEGETLYDHSGNANHGVINGATWNLPPTVTEFLTEIEHTNEPRSFVNNIIQYNDEFLVSLGDRRIKRLDSDGNIVDLFVQLDGTGDLTTIIPFGEYIVAHGSASGYNINNFIIDGSSGSYSAQNLSAGSGYSGSGDIIGFNGDIYMAWATNCCGMGQTWDTELKKLSGVTTDVVWNTEICFSCDQSLGSGSAGLDYPRDLEISGDNLIVVGEKVTNPNTPNPYIVSVDLNGNINWTFTEEDYVGLYKKSIQTNDSGILAAGDGNGFFISRFNAEGQKIWRIEINSIPEDAILTDLIEYDTYALLYGVSSGGVHVVLVDQTSGELFLENQYVTSNVPLVYNAQTQSQIIEIDDGKFIAVYNHGEWWDNTNFSVVTFDLNVQQDTPGSVVINEIFYNPPSSLGSDNDYEFLELYNPGGSDIDLSGYSFTQGINHVFSDGRMLPSGEFLILTKFDGININDNPYDPDGDGFHESGARVIKWSSGSLTNGGEDIEIVDASGQVVDFVDYEDGINDYGDWGTAHDGGGPSLELIDPNSDNSLAENWQASWIPNGTPGEGVSVEPTPMILTVQEIQYVDGDSTESIYKGQYVETTGIVTGIDLIGTRSFIIQDGPGAWNGIHCWWAAPDSISMGDNITIRAFVEENIGYGDFGDPNRGLTLLNAGIVISLNSSGNELPEAVQLSIDEAKNEQYEGVRISVSGTVITEVSDDTNGEWELSDSDSNSIWVNDRYVVTSPSSGMQMIVTGPLNEWGGSSNSGPNWRVEPALEEDVVEYIEPSFSLSFGAGSDIEIAGNEAYSNLNDFSFSIWVKLDSDEVLANLSNSDATHFIINKDHRPTPSNGNWNLRYWKNTDTGDNYFSWYLDVDGSGMFDGLDLKTDLNNVLDDQWHHISGTREQSTGAHKFYIDGELIDSGTSGTNPVISPEKFVLGRHVFVDACRIYGNLDDFSFWDISLTEDEIQSHMYNGLSGDEEGLVGYWNFNEGEGNTLTDLSENANNGIINGASWSEDVYVPPVPGCTDEYAENYNPDATVDDGSCYGYPQDGNRSLSFDGVDDYVNVGNSEDFAITQLSSATIMMWVKPRSNGYLLSKYENMNPGNSNFFLGVEPNGQLRLSGDGTDAWDFGQAMIDQWQHITLVFNSEQPVQAYIDGSFVGSQNINLSSNISDRPLLMGQPLNTSNSDDYLDANIDQLLIWGNALTEEQIQSIMFTDSIGYYSDLLAHWKFNANDGDILFDHSGNANHGSINGATWDEGFVVPPTSVTFLVNLRDYVESSGDSLYDGVYIAGGNIGADNPEDSLFMGHQMSDDNGDLIYKVTLDLERNTHYTYKYRIGPAAEDWNGNWEGVQEQCGEGEWYDRYFYTDFSDNMIVGPYCFSSCDNCEMPNMSLSFNGSGDYVLIPYDNSFNVNNLTIEAWVYSGNFNQNGFIFEKGPLNSQYALFFEGLNLTFRTQHSGNSQNNFVINSSDIGFTSNTWHHLAASYDGTTKKIFVDGSLVASTACSGTLLSNATGSIIGAYSGSGAHHYNFAGLIDEVEVWNTALTESEIQENMYNELTGYEDGLVGYWNFNDGDGDVLTDLTPNGNNGSINGATWSDDVPQPPYTGPEWFVSESGSDDNNGSIDYPFATIQNAINSANDGDSVFVGPSTYTENINLSGKNVSLISTDGPESTIIDGGQNGRVITLDNPNNNDIYNRISGFTIQNGSWNGAGAGIYAYFGNLELVNNIIKDNSSTDSGGGIAIDNNNVSIINCYIGNNSSNNRGGGIYILNNSGIYSEGSIITHNTSNQGGGIYLSSSSGEIFNSSVNNNTSSHDGAGIYNTDGSDIGFFGSGLQYNSSANNGGAVLQKGMFTTEDCIISNNEAGDRGSAFAIINHNGTDVNRCTIVENVGGAIIMLEEESGSDGALLNIINSILWNNNSNGFNTVEGFVPVSISYSNVQGGYEGEGNFDDDPQFCNPAVGNFELAESSSSHFLGQDSSYVGAFEGYGCDAPYMNYSLSFDGNDHVSMTNNIAGTYNEFSISSWVKVSEYGDPNPDYILDVGSSGDGTRIALGINNQGFTAFIEGVNANMFNVNAVSDNTSDWIYVVLSWSGTDFAKMYIDGNLAGETNDILTETLSLESGDVFNIGKRYAGGNFINSILDEVSVWDRALTEEEVQNYYGHALSGYEPGLIAHYNFNESSGDTLFDVTANGNHGTINGATYTSGAPLEAPVNPDPEIFAVNVDTSGNDVSFSVDATGDFSHFQWRLDWDDPVMSYESTSFEDLGPGLHYVRVALVDENNETITDEMLQSFYLLDGLSQYLYEDFESVDTSSGLPIGWSSFSNGQGWYVSDDPYFQEWTAEPGVGSVAISNDDAADNEGGNDFNDGSADFLNMPELDFTSFGGPVALEFGSFFDGNWGQTAKIVYSTDNGYSWNDLTDVWGGHQWERHYFDLFELMGYESVVLGFHSSDNSGWGAGWILDDISIVDAYEWTTFENTHALDFSGDGHVLISGSSDFTIDNSEQGMTIVFWVEAPPELDGSRSIFQGWYGYGYQVYLSNGRVSAVFREPGGIGVGTMGSTDIRGSGYHHVAVTLEGSDVRVYVDGHLDGQGEFNNTLSGNGTDDLSIGHSPWADSEYFSGAIDELAIWSRRTSREDIVRIMSENVGVSYQDDELIAYWNFNSINDGIAIDMSNKGHDGTLVGNTQITDYIPPQNPFGEGDNFALQFYGDDGGIDIGTNNFSIGDSVATLEAWFYREYSMESDSEDQYLIGYGGDNDSGSMFSMGINNNNNLFVSFGGNDYEAFSDASYAIEEWNHLAAVHHGSGQVTLYLNGDSVLASSVSVPDISGSVGKIGASPFGGMVWFGHIDEVRVWSAAKSQSDIQQRMHQSLRGTEESLVAYYNFDEENGPVVYDRTTSNNHGTIYGNFGWTSWSAPIDGSPDPVTIYVPNDYSSIQEAINTTFNGDTIIVDPGTYYENINFMAKDIVIASRAFTTGDLSYIDQTVIDGSGNGHVVFIEGVHGGELNGFTLQNGAASQDQEPWPDNGGGGLFVAASGFRALNLVVTGCSARYGGGVLINGASSYLENVTADNNSARSGGGIHYTNSGDGYANNIRVTNNVVTNIGGGFYVYGGANPNVVGLHAEGNSANWGAGIMVYQSSHTMITNALIIYNTSFDDGGGGGGGAEIWKNSSATFINSTFYGNISEAGPGSAISNGDNSSVSLINSIVWGNNGDTHIENDPENSEISIKNTIVEGGAEGDNVIDADPLFIDPSNNDFHVSDSSLSIGNGLDLASQLSNTVRLRLVDTGNDGYPQNGYLENENGEMVQEFQGEDWGSETSFGPFDLPDGSYVIRFDWDNTNSETNWELITESGWIVRQGGARHSTSFRIGAGSLVLMDLDGNPRPNPDGTNPDMGAYESPLGAPLLSPDITLSGSVVNSEDGSPLAGAMVIAVEENNIYSAQTNSDSSGYYSLDIISGLNYYVNTSLFNYQDQTEYIFVNDSSNYLDISLDVDQTVQDALVEGSLTDWYTNAPLPGASVLFAYSDDGDDMETIETMTDESGYFMAQVPGEQDYDLFLYAEGYWVEHDAFFLGSGESQVLSVGIAPMASASRIYGTVKDFESGDLIPYAEVQLNCETASDWDHTGELGTYRVFNYYAGDCDNGVLVVTASGYETSVQSVGAINFEAGSSVDLDVTLATGDDPDPGMLSGAVYSNIDESPIEGASISAYSITTGQVFDTQADSGYFSLSLPESEYTVAVNADGHQERFVSVSIESGVTLDTTFYLDEVYSNMFFGVVYDSDGNRLDGVTVTANMNDNYDYTELSTVTADGGSYQLIVPDGNFNLSAALTGYQVSWVNDISIENGNQELDFTLEAVESFDGAVMGTVYFFGNLSGSATISVWNDVYSAETTTADNGSYYLDLVNGTYSIFVTSNGYTSIFMQDTITINDNVVTHDIHFSQPGFVEPPIITDLTDAPEDQGRELDMTWSPGDPEDYGTYTLYSVWRKIDHLPPGAPDLWHYIASVEFDENVSSYDTIVPTLVDANSETIHYSTFMVTAHTEDPYIFFDSPPATGFSIDNLFPQVPADIVISSSETSESTFSVDIAWSDPADEDFAYHNVYRADVGSDDPAFVFQTIESSYNDIVSDWGNYEYWVTAVDHNGNESDPSSVAGIELSVEEEVLPEEFALGQNYPNPFNPSTQIRYALPEHSRVTITIYNMLGGKVRTLVNDFQDAGYRNILWNATNDSGSPVSAGMYIYTIKAGNFYQAKKMILLK